MTQEASPVLRVHLRELPHYVDATRSSYEVYYAQTMDYCVPIV
jgi:hypothetical protein